MEKILTKLTKGQLYYIALITVLGLGIVVVAIEKTYANGTVSTVQAEENKVAKMDCISQGHLQQIEDIEETKYKRQISEYEPPEATLFDQNGDKVSLKELFSGDEPVLMNFIYTSCTTICPVLTSGFTKAQGLKDTELGNIKMVSITIDPEYDSSKVLKKYSKRFHADDEWLFLTGNLEDVVGVQNAFDAYRGDKMNHVPLTFLRGAEKKRWLRIEGFPSAEEIAEELKALQKNLG